MWSLSFSTWRKVGPTWPDRSKKWKQDRRFVNLTFWTVCTLLAKAFLITLLNLRKSCATLYRTLWSLIEPQWGSTKSDNCNDTLSFSAALSCSSQAAGMWLVVLLHANFIYKSCGKKKTFLQLVFHDPDPHSSFNVTVMVYGVRATYTSWEMPLLPDITLTLSKVATLT